ncbi:MAG: insulinase family protein [Pseudomonadota bacterium]
MIKLFIKNHRFIISTLIICFLLLFCADTVLAKSSNLLPLWPHEQSDLKPDPAAIYGRLANGFRYVLMQNHEPKNRVNICINVQTGSMQEEDGQEGLAHYLEHILFCGSTHFKPGELIKYFQDMGMDFGPDANAHTGFNETVYEILLPDGKKESIDKGLLISDDFIKGALILDSEVNRERRVILAEKRSRDSSSYRTVVSTMKFKFPDALISKRLPIGEKETIENITGKQLKDFYQAWYRPEDVVLIIVGDFDPKTADGLIKEKFSTLSEMAPVKSAPLFGDIKHKGIKPFYHYEKDEGNTTVSIEIASKVEEEVETSKVRRKRFIANVADRIVRNRLDAMVTKNKAPFTSASISSGTFLNHIQYAGISAECGPENWEESLSAIEQVLRGALENGFTHSEFERVKKDLMAMFSNAVKQASTRDSRMLANDIIRDANNHRVFQSPLQEEQFYAGVLDSISVKDLYDSFINTWKPEHRLVIVTGNTKIDGNTDPKEQIAKVYEKSTLVEIPKNIESNPVFFPYLSQPKTKGKIKQRKNMPDLGIVQIDFENKVRLNLKKTDFEANEIMANISFGLGSSQEPEGLEGISRFSQEVVNESGLGKLDKDELDRALAGKSTNISFAVKDGSFLLRGKTVSNEIELLFQLFYAKLMDPGFRKESYLLSMERLNQKYKEYSGSIDGAMPLFGERFLAGGDTRFGFAVPEKLKKISLDDIISWIGPKLQNDPIEISIVGDFNEDRVVELVGLYFGSLPERKTSGLAQIRSVNINFPSDKSINIDVETEIKKGAVYVAYPTKDIWDIDTTRRLSVLAEVFSEKIRQEVRENMGASYSYFVYNAPSRVYPGYGILFSRADVNPKESVAVENKIKKIASEIAKNGVSKENMKRALDPILTRIKDILRNNGYWLRVLTESQKYPQQIEWARNLKKDYEKITADELSMLAKKYLVNSRAASIIAKPAKGSSSYEKK